MRFASLTASGGNTIITLASPEVNLMTGDLVDICSTTISYDAKGNRVSEAMTVLQSAIAVNRTDDTHFTVGIAIGALTGAAYIVSHGAANWYWDDNGRKGDFVALQWLFDYRTNGQAADNVNTCAGITPGTNNGFQLTPAPAGFTLRSANNSLSCGPVTASRRRAPSSSSPVVTASWPSRPTARAGPTAW